MLPKCIWLAVVAQVACGGEVAVGDATIVVMPQGEPAEGVPVVFHDAEGEVVGEVVTGPDGVATMEVHRDGMVTVRVWDDMYTIAGVQPEEVIELSSWAGFQGEVVGRVSVSAEPVAGAVDYWIALGCEPLRGSAAISPSTLVDLRDTCLEEDGTFDVAVAALDEERVMNAFAYAMDVVPDDDGLTDVPLEWATDLPTIEVSYQGERTGVMDFYGELSSRRKDMFFLFDDQWSEGGAPLSLQHLDEFADAVHLRAIFGWNEDDRTMVKIQMDAPTPQSIVITDDDLPPQLTDARFDLADAERPVASWAGDTASADGVRIQFVYYGAGGATPLSWFVCVEPGGNEFRFPTLPESLAAYGPPIGASLRDSNFMATFESDAIDGYAEFRHMHCLDFWRTVPPAEREFVERHSETRFHW